MIHIHVCPKIYRLLSLDPQTYTYCATNAPTMPTCGKQSNQTQRRSVRLSVVIFHLPHDDHNPTPQPHTLLRNHLRWPSLPCTANASSLRRQLPLMPVAHHLRRRSSAHPLRSPRLLLINFIFQPAVMSEQLLVPSRYHRLMTLISRHQTFVGTTRFK